MYRYFKEIENKVKVVYSIAEQARLKGLDPKSVVEITLASSLAQRTLALIASLYPQIQNIKVEKRIKELEKEYGFLDPAVCLKIAEEIANEKFCKFKSKEEAIDAGVRVAMAYTTLGVVASPIEGYTHFTLKKTKAGKDYFSVYYSGPIRSAGGTAAAFSLLIIDYLREIFGYAKYDPSEIEVKRMITEMHDYHERVTNLQYLPGDEEARIINSNLPIQVNGDPSEQREASNYKDLERIETNRIRNGPCLVLAEGLAQKAPKILKILNKLRAKGFKLSDWSWLEDLVKFQKEKAEKKKKVATATYIQDAVAGRPIFGHPSWPGSFRLRYGRCRLTGYSAMAVHPATMAVLDNFIAFGTQVKLEKPTKAAAIVSCDTIEGPIVKLLDSSVLQVKSAEEAAELKNKIEEIIYIGDLLASYGDFYDRNASLLPCGYNHEWWLAELKVVAIKYSDPEKLIAKTPAQLDGIQKALENLDKHVPSIDDARKISILFGLPLHPNFIFYWSQISFEQFLALLNWLAKAEIDIKGNKILLPYGSHEQEKFAAAKRALELMGLEHKAATANIIIEEKGARALSLNLGMTSELDNFNVKDILEKAKRVQNENKEIEETEENEETGKNKINHENKSNNENRTKLDTLDFINKISRFKIKDKAGTFIGARMGRPEKAKPRELKGSPNVLFPVGEQGGRLRSVHTALDVGYVEADWPIYWCEQCKKESIYFVCHTCGNKTRQLYYCPKCGKKFAKQSCPLHGSEAIQLFAKQKLPVREYFEAAKKHLKLNGNTMPAVVKGIRGTSSVKHIPENLEKGILRAKFGLHVNKDGTIRYDASEVPITQFKPKEIGTSVEKLRELGYTKDLNGKDLKTDDQVLELKPHDVLLPSYAGVDEPADETFFKVANFLDDLLVHFYGMKPFYSLKNKKDLVGHLLLCIAPHNCAGVAGRIIGTSYTQSFLASPYMHAAMRRDADGDEAAMMLMLDALLNFSKEYLPAHRGSTQDSPLALNIRIRPAEVDDMIFNMDIAKEYPLELYMAAEKNLPSSSVKVEQIIDRIKSGEEFAPFKNLFYTHKINDMNAGTPCSTYKTLATMQEKLDHQMALAEKLRSVDTSDVARLVIDRHFIRDLKGNFHKFTRQQFRCVKCNEKYRRPPIRCKCTKCGGKIIFTIAEGSVIKYLESARNLAKKYNVPEYTKQNIELLKTALESVFGRETEKQQKLGGWMQAKEEKCAA